MAAHRYWRVRDPYGTWEGAGGGREKCLELKLKDTIAGTDRAAGNTGIADSSYNGFSLPANAFDGNLGTGWTSAVPIPVDGHWLGVDFGGTPWDILEFAWTNQTANEGPKKLILEWGDDTVTWTEQFHTNDQAVWGAGETRTFNASSVTITPQIRTTEYDALIALNYPSVSVRVSQSATLVPYTSLSEQIRVSQAEALIAETSALDLRVTQAAVLVAVKGRTANPKLRAWTFTLDGHDFYVLRLGDTLTLVYDVYSEQWLDWDGFSEAFWPVNHGINWIGGTALAAVFGSNVLVGDDTFGLIWFLDPEQSYDQSPEVNDPVQQLFFERITMGQVPMTGRSVMPCYAAWLTTDMGDPAYVGAGVTLYISDDAGVTYEDMGLVTVTPGATVPELSWYSLGQIEAPGRLFKIVDDGAVARIDGMEMNDPDDK
jgi:hypothetical protein